MNVELSREIAGVMDELNLSPADRLRLFLEVEEAESIEDLSPEFREKIKKALKKKPGYKDHHGNIHSYRPGNLAGEFEAWARARGVKAHYGTTEGALKGWDTRGRKTDKYKNAPPIALKNPEPEEFIKVRDSIPEDNKSYLTLYTPEQYKEMGAKLYMTEDGNGGFALKGDEILSVFTKPGSHVGHRMMNEAVKLGGKRLDCIGRKLVTFYKYHGFKVTDSLKWDKNYAPKNWNYRKHDTPKIYFMERS